MLAAVAHDWPLMFLWLGLALVVDGVDGIFARAVGTAENAPRWSGEVLDLVVDFTTYVFVPAYAIVSADLMPQEWGLPAGFIIAVTAALYFADTNMKADDNHFVGFPAVWNLIAFYLLLLKPAPWVTIVTIAAFAVLTFLPIRFVHPFRVRSLRAVTVTMLALWAVAGVRCRVAEPCAAALGCCGIVPDRGLFSGDRAGPRAQPAIDRVPCSNFSPTGTPGSRLRP